MQYLFANQDPAVALGSLMIFGYGFLLLWALLWSITNWIGITEAKEYTRRGRRR